MLNLLSELEHIYFCTGARNEKLLSVLDSNKITFEVDERIASFKALGRAKITNRPVGICTTSGTAVSECLSALLEAHYSRVPVVLISGDRPKKLHHTGSPQTIFHQGLTTFLENQFYECEFDQLKNFEVTNILGPIHLNVLVDDTTPHELSLRFHQDLTSFENFLKNKKSPLFLFSHEENSLREFILKFKELRLPFFAETLSGGRDLSSLAPKDINSFDAIIRIGHTPLSKIWRLLEKGPKEVFSFDNRNLPALSYGEVLAMGAGDLINNLQFWEILKNYSFQLPITHETEDSLEENLKAFPLSEPALLRHIQDKLPESSLVYLGNSLVIRFFEMTQKKFFHVFGNRGVNGIDGQLATAIGMAEGRGGGPLYCILGDLTTRYDLSSLLNLPKNLKLIIINNKGGRIFEMLKLNPQIILSHEDNFSQLSSALGLSYSNDLRDLNTHQVLELFPNQEETNKFLQEMNS
jgi:2-succinyl-5-enolpyruvyl-6-hydroxy-3-cyclohexene-1-carboxylate synthase